MRTNRQYLQGILAATVAVSEVTGKLPLNGMGDDTWKVICSINERLLALAAAEAARLAGPQ
jgi:hypothetical protein